MNRAVNPVCYPNYCKPLEDPVTRNRILQVCFSRPMLLSFSVLLTFLSTFLILSLSPLARPFSLLRSHLHLLIQIKLPYANPNCITYAIHHACPNISAWYALLLVRTWTNQSNCICSLCQMPTCARVMRCCSYRLAWLCLMARTGECACVCICVCVYVVGMQVCVFACVYT